MDDNTKQKAKPLLYIVQPEMPPQDAPQMQQVHRSKGHQKKREGVPGEESLFSDREQNDENEEQRKEADEERKLEQLKQEYGVYEALKEIEDEIAAVKKVTMQEEEDFSSLNSNHMYSNTPEGRDALLLKLNELSQYPANAQKPLCEAVVKGKILSLQVLGKHEDSIKVKSGPTVFDLDISEIQHFRLV
ncbi:hypothetical protein [Bacillus sp. CECT 9360]|uniref:hypothetical protein n=1 Tax=Bacillus sp. CECT 9360 TaxID=2845821 RepID=UPI001E4CD0C9|nr:hypothetical protein [Bacillus sp. CECT 9360]CAH0344506.1 hypothetical protein BCI9360_00762 [Bacillus sp. CECT 9360]